MEKLLHERLREVSSDFLDDEIARTLADEIERDYVSREQHKEELRKAHRGCAKPLKFINRGIALGQDWVEPQESESFKHYIDRCYIPRPRFEDGEPVSKGCEVEGGIVDGWCVWDDGAFTLNDEEGNILQEAEPGEFVKRPTPKVYDADGVPCKPGDEVWSTSKEGIYEESDLMIIVGIDAGVKERQVLVRRALGGAGERWVNSKYLTHERPVFDAEGVRICRGDTVWHVGTGAKHLVEELTGDGGIYIDRSSLTWSGNMFTHREPDSLEKLRDDMAKSYSISGVMVLGRYLDRLTALIERGA